MAVVGCFGWDSDAILGSHHTPAVHLGTSHHATEEGNSNGAVEDDFHIFQTNVVDLH